MNSFGLWDRLGVLAIAGALLFAALKAHKSSGRKGSWAGCVLAVIAGMFFLTTFIGGWIAAHSKALAAISVAGLIVIAAMIAFDMVGDRNPDKKSSFWASFLLPLVLVVGFAQLPAVGNQIGKGGDQVMSTINQNNGYHQPPRKK